MDDRRERQPLLHQPSPASSSSLLSLPRQTSATMSPHIDTAPAQADYKQGVDLEIKPDNYENEHVTASKTGLQPPPYVASLSPEERRKVEKALVRKIDLRLIPPIILMYILNYIDRNAIASARLGGLEEELNLKGSEYQTSVSILFVGYILMQVPSNLLMNKLGRPSLYLPIAMMVWGVVSALTAATHNFAGLVR